MKELRRDADRIIESCIRAVQPDEAVKRALKNMEAPEGRLIVISAGKAAWQMARAAADVLVPDAGIVVTKYDHVMGDIPGFTCFEAGHPVPDENGFKPLIPGDELQDITRQLLACGADIVEMNIIRKRLSAVKGGRFAVACSPARVFSIVLSDVLGDPLDMIASGPAYPDASTCEQALELVGRYGLNLSEKARALLGEETPKKIENVTTIITGSVRELCRAAAEECRQLGYEPVFLTDQLECEASEAGRFLGAIARSHTAQEPSGDPLMQNRTSLAFIAGGETVVHLRGKGKGGRNQELALAAAPLLEGLDAAVFSFGSDGTDGPTDAAGGYTDGSTMDKLKEAGINIYDVLADNDAYHALKSVGGLIMTGPTGTNVNDAAVLLIRRQ